MRQTLRKGEILKGYDSFRSVLDEGRVFGGKRIRIFVVFSASRVDTPLVGFGVGRRVESAVVRNRLKRLMREVVRRNKVLLRESCEMASISRLLLMCAPPRRSARPAGPSYQELETEFRTLLAQASHR